VRAYAYSRSWRVAAIRPALEELAALDNVRLWFSCDEETGMPPTIPDGVRVAWLHEAEDNPVPAGAGLVFRLHKLRRTPQRRIGLTLVCPTEQRRDQSGTCSTCGVCWR
jgi:hypothetical protein